MPQGGSAYTRLRRIDDGMSQSLQYWGGLAAQKKLHDDARAEREQVRKQEALDSDLSALDLAPDDFQTTVTGFDTRDDIMRDYATHNTDEYLKWAKIGRDARLRNDDKTYRQAVAMQQRLKSNFKNIANSEPALKELHDNFMTMAQEGKISPVDEEYEGVMQAFLKNNVRVVNDDNGIPYFEALIESENGNRLKRVRVADMVNTQYRPYEVFQLEGEKGWIKTISDNLGLYKEKRPDGTFWTRTTSGWTEANEAALGAAIEAAISSDRGLSSILYQATGAKKKTGFTDEDKNVAKMYLYQRVRGNVGTEDLREWDSGRAAHYRGMEQLRQNAKEDGEKVYDAELVTKTGGGASGEQLPVPSTEGGPEFKEGTDEFTLNTEGGEALTGILTDNAAGEIMTLIRDGKDYYARVRTNRKQTEQSGAGAFSVMGGNQNKTSTSGVDSEYEIRKLSDSEINLTARAMGLPNATYLDGYLSQQKKKRLGDSQPKQGGGASRFNRK